MDPSDLVVVNRLVPFHDLIGSSLIVSVGFDLCDQFVLESAIENGYDLTRTNTIEWTMCSRECSVATSRELHVIMYYESLVFRSVASLSSRFVSILLSVESFWPFPFCFLFLIISCPSILSSDVLLACLIP